MVKKITGSYRPEPLTPRKVMSDEEMISSGHRHLERMRSRRSIREFSDRPVPYSIIENCIKVACLAPSGANLQPWHFSAISDLKLKSEIRISAERAEQRFYKDMKNDEWLRALEPIGTQSNKPHLEEAPWLIIIFAERYGQSQDGVRRKNYYVPESVGIAAGFLISSLHLAGLYCLTHTPNPMGFLNKICRRPSSNKATLILAVGHPADDATVPAAAKSKKPLTEVFSLFDQTFD